MWSKNSEKSPFNGDGIDSNGNIVMTGGFVLAIGPTNSGNGVLDHDGSFKVTGGYLLAIGTSGINPFPQVVILRAELRILRQARHHM